MCLSQNQQKKSICGNTEYSDSTHEGDSCFDQGTILSQNFHVGLHSVFPFGRQIEFNSAFQFVCNNMGKSINNSAQS